MKYLNLTLLEFGGGRYTFAGVVWHSDNLLKKTHYTAVGERFLLGYTYGMYRTLHVLFFKFRLPSKYPSWAKVPSDHPIFNKKHEATH